MRRGRSPQRRLVWPVFATRFRRTAYTSPSSQPKPRKGLESITVCKGDRRPLNRGHAKVSEEDCLEAVKQNAYSLLDDFGFEIRDVSKTRSDILYDFSGLPEFNDSSTIVERLISSGISAEEAENVFNLMLWYGIIGVVKHDDTPMFIYDVQYKMNRMQAEMRSKNYTDNFQFNKAVFPALL